ncbi:MAG: Bax inhibitor-1/YccA family protein, partial [Succinivibrio sp.]
WLSMEYTIGFIVQNEGIPGLLVYGPMIIGLIAAVATCFKPQVSPFTAPLYAVCEGACLGALSGIFEFRYPGIVSTAVMSTFVVVMVMLALWKFHVIVPTQRFRAVVMSATLGVCVLYLLDLVFHLFGASLLPSTGPLAIGISLIVCLIASLNLVLDFENIQVSVDQGLPKYFEYFNAFSLLVTICWLYVEILQLLAQREN